MAGVRSSGLAEAAGGAAAVAAEWVEDFPEEAVRLAAVVPEEAGNMHTKDFVHLLDEKAIASAIAEAEKRTSGEIRVFVSEREVQDAVKEAENQFVALGMTKTAERNGVLIYFAPKSQKYAVIGDTGVHQRCGQDFWQHITAKMTPLLKEGKFSEAVLLAIREIGEVLAREFPMKADDKNELPNQIIREKQE